MTISITYCNKIYFYIIYLKTIKYYKYKSLVYLLYLFIILYSIKTFYHIKLKTYIKFSNESKLKKICCPSEIVPEKSNLKIEMHVQKQWPRE